MPETNDIKPNFFVPPLPAISTKTGGTGGEAGEAGDGNGPRRDPYVTFAINQKENLLNWKSKIQSIIANTTPAAKTPSQIVAQNKQVEPIIARPLYNHSAGYNAYGVKGISKRRYGKYAEESPATYTKPNAKYRKVAFQIR